MMNTNIRTYGPRHKTSPYLFIPDAVDRCRLCLAHSDSLSAIFDSSSSCTEILATRIFTCLSILVVQNKNLPSNICNECYNELNRYYEFKKKCQGNDAKLKKYLNLVQLQETVKGISRNRQLNIRKEDANVEIFNDRPSYITSTPNEGNCSETNKVESHLTKLVRAALQWNNTSKCNTVNEKQTTIGNIEQVIELGDNKIIEVFTNDDAIVTLQLEEELVDADEATTVISLQCENDPTENSTERCVYCPGVKFQDRAGLEAHMTVHRSSKGGACVICNRWYEGSALLERHMKKHSEERPHACDDCGKRFTQKATLHRHQLTHLEKRPYECAICSKSYTQPESLRSHMRSHQPPAKRALRLSTCPVCSKRFCHRSGLTRHMKSHKGEVYSCPLCYRKFSDQSSLRRHKYQHMRTSQENNEMEEASVT